MEFRMAGANYTIQTAASMTGLSSKVFRVVRVGLLAHKDGTMKGSCSKNKLKEKESLRTRILGIDIRESGKVTFLMEKGNRLGSDLEKYQPTRVSMLVVKNMEEEYIDVEMSGSTKGSFPKTSSLQLEV